MCHYSMQLAFLVPLGTVTWPLVSTTRTYASYPFVSSGHQDIPETIHDIKLVNKRLNCAKTRVCRTSAATKAKLKRVKNALTTVSSTRTMKIIVFSRPLKLSQTHEWPTIKQKICALTLECAVLKHPSILPHPSRVILRPTIIKLLTSNC